MRALTALFVKDLKLIARAHVLWLALATVALGIVVGHAARDGNLTFDEGMYLVDRTREGDLARRLGAAFAEKGFRAVPGTDATALAEVEGKHHAWLPSEGALREALDAAEVGFGAVFEGSAADPEVRYLLPAGFPEGTARLMAGMWDAWVHATLAGRPAPTDTVPTVRLGPEGAEAPTMGETLVPVFLFGEAFLVGIWLGAVLLFVERADRTAAAMAVAPSGLVGMVVAKGLALALVVVLEVVLTVVGVWGWHPGLGAVLLVSLVLFLQALGITLACAAWFQSLTAFTLVGALLSAVASLPVASFYASSFPRLWWLPTWPLFQALREGFFPSGGPGGFWAPLGVGALLALVFLFVGDRLYRRALARA